MVVRQRQPWSSSQGCLVELFIGQVSYKSFGKKMNRTLCLSSHSHSDIISPANSTRLPATFLHWFLQLSASSPEFCPPCAILFHKTSPSHLKHRQEALNFIVAKDYSCCQCLQIKLALTEQPDQRQKAARPRTSFFTCRGVDVFLISPLLLPSALAEVLSFTPLIQPAHIILHVDKGSQRCA